MALERDYVLFYGPKSVVEDGRRSRNKVLQPCGCWVAEVWREVRAPVGVRAIGLDGRPEPIRKQWCQETQQCAVHSAKAAVLALTLGARLNGAAFSEKLGDGAKRLLADSARVFAEADAIDRELKALGSNIQMKQLPQPKRKKKSQ